MLDFLSPSDVCKIHRNVITSIVSGQYRDEARKPCLFTRSLALFWFAPVDRGPRGWLLWLVVSYCSLLISLEVKHYQPLQTMINLIIYVFWFSAVLEQNLKHAFNNFRAGYRPSWIMTHQCNSLSPNESKLPNESRFMTTNHSNHQMSPGICCFRLVDLSSSGQAILTCPQSARPNHYSSNDHYQQSSNPY